MKETDIYREILSEREWISFISSRPLNEFVHPLNVMMFAHILPKGTYPELQFDKDNILLVHPDEHILIDHGTQAQRREYEQKYDCDFSLFYYARYNKQRPK